MNFIRALVFVSSAGAAFALAVEDCPGYVATNVVTTDNSITADLTLNGQACNVYGEDIADLRLLVEYQSGKLLTERAWLSYQKS